LGFLELPQFQAVFDTVEAFIVLMMKRVEIIEVAVMRLKGQAHGIQFVAQIASLLVGFVNPLM